MSMTSTANFPTTRVSDHKGLTSSCVSFRSEDFFLSRCAANLSYSSGVRISFLADETWKEPLVAKYCLAHSCSFKIEFKWFPRRSENNPLSSIVIHCYPLVSIAIHWTIVFCLFWTSGISWHLALCAARLGITWAAEVKSTWRISCCQESKICQPIKIHQKPSKSKPWIYSIVHVVFWW